MSIWRSSPAVMGSAAAAWAAQVGAFQRMAAQPSGGMTEYTEQESMSTGFSAMAWNSAALLGVEARTGALAPRFLAAHTPD